MLIFFAFKDKELILLYKKINQLNCPQPIYK